MRAIESLFLGILAAVGALVLEVFAASFFYSPAFQRNGHLINGLELVPVLSRTNMLIFVVFAVIEESMKYLMVAKKIEKFSVGKKVLTNSLFLGVGFGIFELFLIYYQRIGNFQLLRADYLPLAEVFMLHVFTAGMIGYYVIVRNPEKISTCLLAVLTAGFFHFGYNLLASYQNLYVQIATGAFFVMLAAINLINYSNTRRHLD